MATANLSSALSSFSLVRCSEVDLQILVGCGVLDLAEDHGNHVTVHFVVGREGLHYGIDSVASGWCVRTVQIHIVWVRMLKIADEFGC